MLEFNLREHYSVLQALDEVGRALYGDTWMGTEPWATPSDDPTAKAEQKARAAQRVRAAKVAEDAARRDLEYADSEEETAVAQENYLSAHRELTCEESSYHQFPETLDSWQCSFECFQRRQGAETKLFEALVSGSVRLIYKGGNEAPWDAWVDQRGFRLYTNLSTIREPRYARSGPVVGDIRSEVTSAENPRRDPFRHAAFVRKHEFEVWLFRQAWAGNALLMLEPELQCRIHLKILISETAAGKVRLREECKARCLARVHGLSEANFLKAWDEVAPEAWRGSGRRAEETILHTSP